MVCVDVQTPHSSIRAGAHGITHKRPGLEIVGPLAYQCVGGTGGQPLLVRGNRHNVSELQPLHQLWMSIVLNTWFQDTQLHRIGGHRRFQRTHECRQFDGMKAKALANQIQPWIARLYGTVVHVLLRPAHRHAVHLRFQDYRHVALSGCPCSRI
ncbi:Uncharacterised protein [Mycobacteroides abscessus subsp. abscessus]|nr:Uncharacterised protein [Mycobacteroides abscessus subsp. abscessus]